MTSYGVETRLQNNKQDQVDNDMIDYALILKHNKSLYTQYKNQTTNNTLLRLREIKLQESSNIFVSFLRIRNSNCYKSSELTIDDAILKIGQVMGISA
jgi:hypothetical protein